MVHTSRMLLAGSIGKRKKYSLERRLIIMSEYASIKYANTFLNQVIIRVDFLDFIENDSIRLEEVKNKTYKR